MAKPPIEIGVASEGRAFREGIESDVIPPLEDAQKELRDLAKSGEKTGDGLEDVGRAGRKSGDQLEQAMREAQRESDRTRADVEKLGDEIVRAGRKGKDLDDGVRRGTQGASEAVAEFKQEAVQNLSETVSSFRGEAEDIAQIAQDTLGGVIGNMGPAGLAAGVAGAAGIGLIIAAVEQTKEHTAQLEAKAADLAAAWIEAGSTGELSIEQIADRMRDLATTAEEGVTNLADLRDQAEGSASGFRRLAEAYAGNTAELDKIIEAEEAALTAAESRARQTKTLHGEQVDDQRALVNGLKELQAETDLAAEKEAAWLAAGGPELEAKAAAIEQLQGELDEAVGAWGEYYNAETGATDPAGYMAAMQARIDATQNFNSNVRTLADATGLTMEEAQAVLDQGVDFAPMLASIVGGGQESMEKYAGLVQQIVGGGQEIADGSPITLTGAAETGQAEADLDAAASDRTSEVTARTNTKAAESALDTVAEERTATIKAKAETKGAAEALAAFTSTSRVASIGVSANLGPAERALSEFVNRPRTVVVDVRTREGRPVP
ncbi:hypothetical protein [Leucobacter chironomi]|uniref:hypothetical protein n=1 Tax=Leucobacter chironomi TaxID=491918 RepID=UPI000400ACEC|nr:hypothetical protein [Leucobacter chironomi]